MKIIAVYFAREKKYNQLLTVFERSARNVMPNVKLDILKIKKPEFIDHQRDTAFSFLSAAQYVYKLNEDVAVTDIDSLFLKPLNNIWNNFFDIAISIRNHRVKYNTGIWVYRHTKKAKIFLKLWINWTKLLMKQFDNFEYAIRLHGGIDQASLFIALVKSHNIKIKKLPCQEWNATQSEWKDVDENTRMIHIKSDLRQLALSELKEEDVPKDHEYIIPIANKWRSYL